MFFFGFESIKEVCEFLISFCVRKQGRNDITIKDTTVHDISDGIQLQAAPRKENWTLTAADWKKIARRVT